MQVGDIVKSYDFPGNTDCYMVGKVVSISQQFGDFRAKFVKRVWLGKNDTKFKTDYFTAPLQGNSFGDSSFERVVVIG
jgi:hypothetical protein